MEKFSPKYLRPASMTFPLLSYALSARHTYGENSAAAFKIRPRPISLERL